jgi:tRNA pseudouridine55 synthase
MVQEGLGRERAMFHHGIVNVNKPQGWTSHDVVAKLRKLLQMKKIGHAGTLDPDATGVLPILLGQATRLSEFLVEWDKEYEAVLRLGQETDTQDATGKVIRETPLRVITEADLKRVLTQFQGRIQQVPPMYSAVKIAGQPLYKAARKGKVIPRQPRSVTIYQLELKEMFGADVHLRITCSKGTYIRTLCADIGERLGVGGHLCKLVRTRVGPFSVEDSLSLEKIQETSLGECQDLAFLSLDQALSHVPSVLIDDEMLFKVKNGAPISLSVDCVEGDPALAGLKPGSLVKIKDQSGKLLALGNYANAQGQEKGFSGILIKKVFNEFSRGDRGESSLLSKSLACVGPTTSFPEGSVQCH